MTTVPPGAALRLAFLVSTVGDWVYRLAVPMLVLQVTGSAVSTAIAYVLEFVPYIAIGLVSGVVADRADRRVILVVCDTISCVFALGVAAITLMDEPSLPLLYACAFLLACVRPFYFPAFQGFLVDVVAADRLANVNSWTQTVESILGFTGPVVGTVLIAAMGASTATLVNAATFFVSAGLVFTIAYRRPEPAAGEGTTTVRGMGRDFVAGLRTLWATRPVLAGTVLMAVANLAAFVVEGSLFYLVLNVMDLPSIALGVVFGAQGLGAVLGAVLAPKLLDRFHTGLLLSWGMGLSGAAMLVPVVVPTWLGVVVGWAVEGVATSVIVVTWFTGRQRLVPSASIGRVAAVGRAVAYATIPVGTLLGSVLVTGEDTTRTLFLVAAAIQLAVFVACLLSPLKAMDTRSALPEPEEAARD
ncbi:MFS transporter [Actinosynnema sp. NPDC023658]|uniref:MFS transporter n=1 Tax=Actinosynnema sp. NPDC023658 TaxID=3155465 RepID=UPI0033FFF9DD